MEQSTSVNEGKVTDTKMVIKSFGCQGDKWITVELQDPFMWGAVFAFAKIQSHLRYLLQLHQSNIR